MFPNTSVNRHSVEMMGIDECGAQLNVRAVISSANRIRRLSQTLQGVYSGNSRY